MRPFSRLLWLGLLTACHHAAIENTPRPVPPDYDWNRTGLLDHSISCDTPVVIKARNESQGIDDERRFLAKHYPGHSPYGQSLVESPYGRADELRFKTADGKPVSVCFDINSFFGQW